MLNKYILNDIGFQVINTAYIILISLVFSLLFLMYHKACRLLVRHDGYIRDLQAFRLVRYI